MSYLLDTCIFSKLRKIKAQPDQKLTQWIGKHRESDHFVSALTIGEIQSGISKLRLTKDGEREKHLTLEEWLVEGFIPRFQGRILSVDLNVALAWGKLDGECRQRGIVVPIIDGLIAATAIVHNLIIVTHNVKDFIPTGARIVDPWLD